MPIQKSELTLIWNSNYELDYHNLHSQKLKFGFGASTTPNKNLKGFCSLKQDSFNFNGIAYLITPFIKSIVIILNGTSISPQIELLSVLFMKICCVSLSGRCRARTYDPLINSQMLLPTELIFHNKAQEVKLLDLNQLHYNYQLYALPIELNFP